MDPCVGAVWVLVEVEYVCSCKCGCVGVGVACESVCLYSNRVYVCVLVCVPGVSVRVGCQVFSAL